MQECSAWQARWIPAVDGVLRGVLLAAGMVLTGMHYVERRKTLEKESDRIAAQYLVTFYKQDKPCGKSGRKLCVDCMKNEKQRMEKEQGA